MRCPGCAATGLDAAVLVEIDPDVFLQPADYFTQERREPLVLPFQVLEARFDGLGALALFRNLALLIEVPEQSHSQSPVYSWRVRMTRVTRSATGRGRNLPRCRDGLDAA